MDVLYEWSDQSEYEGAIPHVPLLNCSYNSSLITRVKSEECTRRQLSECLCTHRIYILIVVYVVYAI